MPDFKPRTKEEPIDIWNIHLPLNAIWGIYARQSTPAQLIKNTQSTEMQTDDLVKWIEGRNLFARKICLFDADLGVSGTLRIDQRSGLQELVARIEADEIKVVLVYQISRLFRDETGVQYNVFATKCKEHHCLLVTADGMLFNFDNPMHIKMFRYLAELAAEYIPTQIKLLHQARLRKARLGFYAGQGNVSSGYIVDYKEESKTFGKLIVYEAHKPGVLQLFERYYELGGSFNALCREVDQMPYVFPDFEPGMDKRNINHWKHRKHVPGGYRLTRFGIYSILTNPVYIGWWIVAGDIISRTNHEALLDKEHEYLFWYAFERLSDYTIQGEANEKRVIQKTRYYQKNTDVQSIASGLLKDRVEAEGAKVYVHRAAEKYNYILSYSQVRGGSTTVGDCQIDAATVDHSFATCFFTHLEEVHELDEYQRFLAQEQTRKETESTTLTTQLLEAETQQEAVLDEITAIRKAIKQQIYREQEEDIMLDTEKRQQELEAENKPILDRLRKRFNTLETLKKEVQEKLDAQPSEPDDVQKARRFASFTVELEKLRQVWEKKPFAIRKEFVNLFVKKAIISIVAPHWIALEVSWSYPKWGNDIMYLWRNHGVQSNWTEAERALVRQHHQKQDMEAVLRALPTKTWKAIKRQGVVMGLPPSPRTVLLYPTDLCWLDLQFMQEQGISNDKRTKYISVSMHWFLASF
jgi:hypothetical protein